jgi:hypothetical protein
VNEYRKKPVVIEAIRVNDALAAAALDWPALTDWMAASYEAGDLVFAPDGIHIRTLEGAMHAARGDWIIRGVKGELYPCKPDIFEATYEDVSTPGNPGGRS